MKTRSAKITFLFALYAALHVAEACVNCDCEATLPYFDYNSILIGANSPQIGPNIILELFIEPDSIEYLAQSCPGPAFLFSNAGYACSCNENGELGDKYTYTLDILTDKVFNDTLPAGASLNTIFFVNGGDVSYPLPVHAQGSFGLYYRPLHLYGYSKPKNLNEAYRFRVILAKSNGDTLTAETGDIYFQ